MQNLRPKNLAIVAHVDHGKTTLMDGLLKQSGASASKDLNQDRVLDSMDLEREKGITIKAKNCAIYWKDQKINLLDTPGHADFGGEVERSLMMVDGIFLLVDAAEGPLPQTRFVLQKAMELDLDLAVIVNKIDRPDQRASEVKQEVEDLYLDIADYLGKDNINLDIPFFYASAKEGWASNDAEEKKDDLECLLDFMVGDYFQTAKVTEGEHLQLLVTNLSYSSYLGQLLIGKIQRGSIEKNQNYVCCGSDEQKKAKVTDIKVFHNLGEKSLDKVYAGEIVIVAGFENVCIGDTLCTLDHIDPLPRLEVEPPTVSVHVSVSTSPLSGKEGTYLTSRKLEEYLEEICLHNVALKYAATEDPKVYQLSGRGELQMAIVFEQLRRKGYEFMLGRPQVILKEDDSGGKLEPFETLSLDLPKEAMGTVTEQMASRKGVMKNMLDLGGDRVRLEYYIPSRGVIGFRSQYLNITRGEGLVSSLFAGYEPFCGEMMARQNGALVADRAGKATAYALFQLLSNGKQFIAPGEVVYEGMVIGEHNRTNDTNVNVIKEKHLSNVRTAGKDTNIVLQPPPVRNIEWALDWIDQDEWAEVTPLNIRIRKKILKQNERSVIRGR